MYNVIKRDGAIVDFDITKISTAIRKAFDATETQYNEEIMRTNLLAIKLTFQFHKVKLLILN